MNGKFIKTDTEQDVIETKERINRLANQLKGLILLKNDRR